MPQTAEQTRLLHDGLPWKHWGPYLSDSLPKQARGIAAAALPLFATTAFAAEPPAAPKKSHVLPLVARECKGDFDGMVERRGIRLLMLYSRTLYFNDKGQRRGITADFERYINQKDEKQLGKRPIPVIIVPTARATLLQNVVDGLVDIATGDLTVTDESRKLVNFIVAPDQMTMRTS